MHILQIVTKNTSTIDFSLPLLGKIRKDHPDWRLSILFCTFDKRQILRRSEYFPLKFGKFKIVEYDFAAFLKKPYRLIEPFLRYLFSAAQADKINLRELYRQCRGEYYITRLIRLMRILIKGGTLREFASSLLRNALVQVERRIAPRMIQMNSILPELGADVILFDNRTTTTFYGRDAFYAFMNRAARPVILLPHGPHYRDPVSEFTAFDEKNPKLPEYCDYWMPLRFGTPWVYAPQQKEQFAIVGYPGLDSDWINHSQGNPSLDGSFFHGRKRVRKKCLFIVRRYLPEGVERAPDLDPFIIDYEDFFIPLQALATALYQSEEDIEVIIKPHPVNNYKTLAHDFTKVGIKNWRITHDPIYAVLPEIDIVVSIFSTILLVPAMAGIPTIVVETKLQRHVHQGWPLLEKLYKGFNFYLENVDKFPDTFHRIMTGLATGEIDLACRRDMTHLRYFFPDGATQSCQDRLESLGYGQKDDTTSFTAQIAS
jgi:hypothetical protein